MGIKEKTRGSLNKAWQGSATSKSSLDRKISQSGNLWGNGGYGSGNGNPKALKCHFTYKIQ